MEIKGELDTIYKTTGFNNDHIIHQTTRETDSILSSA